MLRFDRLQTPRRDGEVLIEPAAALWAGLIEQDIRHRKPHECTLRLAGMPIEEVRHATRARVLGPKVTGPVIACGHQPEFAHPGVWAKHVIVAEVASRLGAHGADLVVDNDAPRTTALTLPDPDPDGYIDQQIIPVLRGTTGAAYESRPPLNPAAIDAIQRQIADTLAGITIADDGHLADGGPPADGGRLADTSLVFQYLSGVASAARPRDFVEQHLAGRAHVDRLFAIDLQEIRVSDAFNGPFVADILLNLERFAHEYNSSLAEYRREQRVRSPDRPLPDLKRVEDRLEAPFWIYQPLQQRRRLWIASRGDALDLFAGPDLVGTLSRTELARSAAAALASLAPWVIRPRALTLTLWARLLLCNLFVHGIGGAKYDRINDGIFRRYYGCEPPPYACVSATLRLPLPRFAVSRSDLLAARRRVRDLRFNPQRYVADVPADLLAARNRLIAQGAELRASRAPALQRREVFRGIREINERLSAMHPELTAEFDAAAARIGRQLASNAIADSREFFYALQPRSRLEMLAGSLRETVKRPEA